MYKENKQSISKYDLIKEIPSLYIDRPYLKEIDSMSLRCTIFDLDNSYNKFFKEKQGFPKYKSKWKGKKLYKIDTYFPSSQICSKCGYKNKVVLDLKVRKYNCPSCHSNLDRDINAAEKRIYENLSVNIEQRLK